MIDSVRADPFQRQLMADPCDRQAAAVQARRPIFRIRAIIQKTALDESVDDPVDDRCTICDESPFAIRTRNAGGAPDLPHQNPPQVLGGTRKSPEIEQGRIFDPPLGDLARVWLSGHGAGPPGWRAPPSRAALWSQKKGEPIRIMHNPSAANWLGLWTLYLREVRRFAKVYTQTLLAPIVTTLLFLAIFSLALGRSVEMVGDVTYVEFLVPGLIMMAIMQNAFANTSSSLVIAKVQGNIVDSLMPPLTAHELTFGFAMGGATRGVAVGLTVGLAMVPFVTLHLHHLFFVIYHAVMASLFLSLLGVAGGIWSEKFDHIAAVTNFIVTPLSFLSGTFYTVERLPPVGQTVAHLNPFFYMIDGFRYGFIGHADIAPWIGVLVMAGANLLLWLLCYRMFARGYKLKA